MAMGKTLLCIPSVAKTVEEMAGDMAAAAAMGADVVELRLDCLSSFQPRSDLERLLTNRPVPALVTYRPKWEGGEYDGDDETRIEVLLLAMELGADYVDIEFKVAARLLNLMSGKKPENLKLIISSHNYEMTPSVEELGNLAASIQTLGADIVKITTTANDISDVSRMFQLIVHSQVRKAGADNRAGHEGQRRHFPSALPQIRGYLTFGSLNKGRESAPGQITGSELLNVYRIREIGPDTKVFGIIGKPVGHSKSPNLHNDAFRAVGFNAVYVPYLVDDLPSFLNTYSSPDFAGFSCTIPHKEEAVTCCDEVDPIAKAIGAVNTIIRRPSDGKLIGYNTDYVGAISAIEDGIAGYRVKDAAVSPLAGRLFVVIGAGGAGKALAYGAKEKGAKVVIANRTYERAKQLANLIGGHALTLADLENYHPEEGMILANTTSIGMHPNVNDTPLSKQALKHYAVVFDAVYTPKVTRLLREAEESGSNVVSGLEMFIRQAMGQFELFTGLTAPESLMRDIVLRINA